MWLETCKVASTGISSKIISKSTIRVQLQTHEHTDSTREGKSKGNVRLRVYIILYDDEYQNISFCVKSGGWPDSGWAFSPLNCHLRYGEKVAK